MGAGLPSSQSEPFWIVFDIVFLGVVVGIPLHFGLREFPTFYMAVVTAIAAGAGYFLAGPLGAIIALLFVIAILIFRALSRQRAA